MKRYLVYTTDDLRLRPIDSTQFYTPAPHENRRWTARVEKVGLERRPLPNRRGERSLVEIIEPATDRHAVRETRYLHIGPVQKIGDVVRRGLPVDGGVEGEDYLRHRRIMCAGNERIDRKVGRPDAVERRERPAQHVIARIDRVRSVERPEVGDVGDHDDDGGVTAHVRAHRARVLSVDIAAHATDLDFLERGLHGGGERRHDLLALL